MNRVRAKKHLGQHFLTEIPIAEKIAAALTMIPGTGNVLEIGPGTGILTRALLSREIPSLQLIEIDSESVEYLHTHHPELKGQIIEGDFLKLPLETLFGGQAFSLIGNFPYNISSQILFRMLEDVERIPEMVGMFQREVAQRIASPSGNKDYGILSVLIQTYYTVEYLFTVPPSAFNPPPKVHSAVIRLARNERKTLPVPGKFFKVVVKTAFNQRRKTLRNSLASLIRPQHMAGNETLFSLRPERLEPDAFLELAAILYEGQETQS